MKMDNQRGFTLVELVIAFTILAIMMTVGYSSLYGILQAKITLDDGRDNQAVASSVLLRLTRELQLATSGLPLMPPKDRPEERYPSSVSLVGQSKELPSGASGDSITFLAQEGGQYLLDGGRNAGIVQITYRVEPDPEQVNDRSQTYFLVREETPYIRPFDKAYERSMIFPVTKNLVELKFSYMSEDAPWSNSWGDQNKVKLPELVKFTVRFRSPRGKIDSFTTTVPLRTLD